MIACVFALLALVALLAAAPLALRETRQETLASETPKCALAVELADAATGDLLAGVISVRDEAGKRVPLPELLPRGLGVEAECRPEPAVRDADQPRVHPRARPKFADDQEQGGVLRVYEEGIRRMQERIDAAPKAATP